MARALLLLGLAGVALVLLNHNVLFAQQSGKPPVFTEFKSKLALDGYDASPTSRPASRQRAAPSTPSTWNGATWHFASPENKAAFEASPQAYAPQYGGYCAWAVSEGYTAKGDPSHWRIVDGKLYLNYNASVQKSWEKDIPGHIAKGDKNWPTVLGK